MSDRKISQLTPLTTPAAGDYLPIVDISEASAANKNKRITVEELLRGAPNGTAAAPSFAFESDPDSGLYSAGANAVAISTGGTERARVDSNGYFRLAGGGVQFNGDTAAANALDDYEEGTFTPVFRDGVSGTAATAATAYGNYTKIGNCVRFHIAMVNVNTSGLSSANTIHITGLPFPSFSVLHVEQSFPVVFNSGSVAANYVTFQIARNDTHGILVTNSTTGQAVMPVSIATSGSFDFWVSGVYFV